MGNEPADNKEPWLAHLDKEYLFCEEGTVEQDLASIIKDMLLSSESDSDNAAPTAARGINTYYWDRNLDSGPLFKFQRDDIGFFDFLSFLYHVIVRVPCFIPYNGSKQNTLVQLLLEIHKLPPSPIRAWNVCLTTLLFIYYI